MTAHPNNAWVTQQARNLLIDLDGHLDAVKFLLRDRDTKFTAAWDAVFTGAGITILRSPVRAPRANAIMERWIGGCRRELLDHTSIWNQRHLLQVLREHQTHHNEHRPHHNEHRPHRSLQQAAPLKQLPHRFTISTRSGSADAIGSAVSSTNTHTPHDADQVLGTHSRPPDGHLGSRPPTP